MQRHVEIAGGGIAGLAAAAAFGLQGWSVRVHERSETIRAHGSGIYLWENGLRVLEKLGAFEDTVKGAHWGVVRETRDRNNATRSRQPVDTRRDGRVVTVPRQQLLEALAKAARAAGAEIVTGSAAVAATPEGLLTLDGGQALSADLIVAADGVNSRVRDSLGLLRSRKRLGDGAIRFIVPRTLEERQSVEGGSYIEYWSGSRRILYTPCNDELLYLAMTSMTDDEAARRMPFPKDVWIASFPHLRDVIDRIDQDGRWDDFEVVRLKAWSSGRVAIIGDAAHAQAPNLGQGGGCALMSALSLAAYAGPADDIPSALQAWESAERPLVEHSQRYSSFLSVVTNWPEAVRNSVLALTGRSKWFRTQRWKTARHIPTGS